MNKRPIVSIKRHNKDMKSKYASFPKLPKKLQKAGNTVEDNGHTSSVIRGYQKRVKNWENKNNPANYVQNKYNYKLLLEVE